MSLASNLAKLGRLLLAQASGVVIGVSPSAGDSSKALATTEWFKSEQAAETTPGTAKVATQAQTNTGTDDTTIVTPKKLRAGFSVSLGGNGYIAFPTWLGGLILQWGNVTQTGAQNVSVTFPIAFPNGVFSSGATSANSTGTGNGASVYSTGKAGMAVALNSAYSFSWYSIGY